MENSILREPVIPFSLEVEPGYCVVDIMPRGSPVHLAPRAVIRDGSYSGTSILFCMMTAVYFVVQLYLLS